MRRNVCDIKPQFLHDRDEKCLLEPCRKMTGSQWSVEERNDKRRNHIDDLLEDWRRYRIGCRKFVRKSSNGIDDVIGGQCWKGLFSLERAWRNIGGGEPLVLDCTLATFSTKKRLNDFTSMTELAGKRPRPSRMSTDRHSFRGSDWSDYSVRPEFGAFLSTKFTVWASLIVPRRFHSDSDGGVWHLDGRRMRGVGSGSTMAGSRVCSFQPTGQTLGDLALFVKPWVRRLWTPGKFTLEN